MTDRERAAQSAAEERQAVRTYEGRRADAASPALRRALTHAIGEERQHRAAFARLARRRRR